ncbi:MEKHLA domain-containing protein [Tumidithrix elongata RA019]|uniref:MEKHLA domain-containing protein n=1 Tax=Tumidithrix elongata BACA0141 TaxID=2716417 RepID=A0AAW9PWP9_9CYAN|nr:MEKHLA domain-containing protein [Tumidithrix elongata RA019]
MTEEIQSMPPIWQQEAIVQHSQRLLYSFEYLTGKPLLQIVDSTDSPMAIARALFEADFVVVSHGLEADPILNYGNLTALKLWQMEWQQFTTTPSRFTAEPIEREERDRVLTQTRTQGFIENYRGLRINSVGQRFYINNAIVWNAIDEQGKNWGQAATFSNWEFV